jgi:hypothetical protein
VRAGFFVNLGIVVVQVIVSLRLVGDMRGRDVQLWWRVLVVLLFVPGSLVALAWYGAAARRPEGAMRRARSGR